MTTTINASTSAGIVTTADTSGVLELQTAGTTAVSISASQVVTLTNALAEASGGTGTSTGYYGFKNRIINGAMVIDQRNAGASVTFNDETFPVDRFRGHCTQTSKLTAQRSSTAPAGFSNSLLLTSSSAYSVTSGDIFVLGQGIEGFNVGDLGWGTANAQTITLSFWVRSSLTGTFGGALRNSAGNRAYPFTYTISVANTFEYKTVTVVGDTSGTWLTDNGVGIRLVFSLGAGSTYSGTAGAWAGSNFWSATGATSVVGTNGATFYITGVQLEKGSTATSFDYRPYGTELALCQRYFVKTNTDNASRCGGMWGSMYATTAAHITGSLLVAMRAAPTVSRGGTSDTFYISNVNGTSAGTIASFTTTTMTIDAEVTSMSTAAIGYPVQYNGQLSIAAEL